MKSTPVSYSEHLIDFEQEFVKTVSHAPLQIAGTFDFDASQDVVLRQLTATTGLLGRIACLSYRHLPVRSARWTGGRPHPATPCQPDNHLPKSSQGDPQAHVTYQTHSGLVPFSGFFSLAVTEPNGRGGTLLTLRQYFSPCGRLLGRLSHFILLSTLRFRMARLQSRLAGIGGSIQRVT